MISRRLAGALRAFLILLAMAWSLGPLYWMYSTAFKPGEFERRVPPVFVFQPTLENFQQLLERTPFLLYLQNTVIIAGVTTVAALSLGSLAAYSFTRFRYPGSDVLPLFYLVMRMLPRFVLVIPYYLLMRTLGLLNTHSALILAYSGFSLPFVIWMMIGFFKEIPIELEEAAMVDGCNRLTVLVRIVLPLAAPGLAAARIYASTGDAEVKARADRIVSELGRCQRENGGEWVFPIPEKYLHRVARGKTVWAPQYTIHKTLMGLYDAFAFAGNEQALDIMSNAARWFHRWTGQFTREQMDDVLDVETGGMLEAWADLYGVTGKEEHLDLVRRYDRPRLFNRLLDGEDALTNQHANTTIPEAQGAARAWEVTGEQHWRDVAFAYWDQAVTKRGCYCTGGQSCGEFWTPPNELAARLGDKTQEHCTVYNMMRLAEYLLRWTGDVQYADYWERNLYNGILAQQNPLTGMVSYFLPLHAGATKQRTALPWIEKTAWGRPTEDFWCCHGTLVQAHSAHGSLVYFEDDEGLVVAQYVSTELAWQWSGAKVKVTQTLDPQLDQPRRPQCLAFDLAVECERSVEFTLKVRLPWWLHEAPRITVNGTPVRAEHAPSSYHGLRRTWHDDRVHVELPRGLTACPLPDDPDTVAFMDGPVLLAGLCDEERTLYGDRAHPETMLVPDNEREWRTWRPGYRTRGQERGLRFLPLHDVVDERYTVYFPVKSAR